MTDITGDLQEQNADRIQSDSILGNHGNLLGKDREDLDLGVSESGEPEQNIETNNIQEPSRLDSSIK